MKKLLPALPLVAFLAASCSKNVSTPVAETLPPVVEKKKTSVASTTPKKKTTYKKKSSYSKPKSKKVASTNSSSEINSSSSPSVIKTETAVKTPLTPDPTRVAQITEIPRFEVPENIQPKMSDGINQAEFIELKW